jgi:phosphoribosyl-AMP cyclohydrolase
MIHFIEKENKREQRSKKQEKTMQKLRFDKGGGLLPVIAQDHVTGEILMLAYINQEAWDKTLSTGKAHYWSRSRNKLWLKGESSNHVQLVKEILVDCDEDTVVYRVEQLGGAACHTGYRSCFFRHVQGDELVIKDKPVFDPQEVYKK